MRIAFVGKGGSGKTTLCALFTLFLEQKKMKNIYVVDADLNKNLATQLGLDTNNVAKLGEPENQKSIRLWLMGNRTDVPQNDLKYFKKTTPPRFGSNVIRISEIGSISILSKYFVGNTFKLAEIGEYDKSLVAKNCYHGSLSILENILSHLDDRQGWFIADMVAGTDTFVGALFAQFDFIFIVAEPTRNSREVVNQFEKLALATDTINIFKVIANKIENQSDVDYIQSFSKNFELVCRFEKSKYIKEAEKTDSKFEINKLEKNNLEEFEKLLSYLSKKAIDPNYRLSLLRKWHHKVAMDHTGEDRKILLNQITNDKVFG
ncbi:hypothetical protein D6810_00365 [Candidatus Dojkabacteria bacterium]|uniref:CobQ/CobB/MinD/ParA nucleotide binding domain-containing protein n=1 Tax=Candidatus Dojkabacteria bacterium TaxID=2099670 RepID=A0A3M0Z014_9BACT|nr:MAG: hypothetical protein D6810_00365 [Candidatus Dojkabacteria bacterium]